MKGTITIIRQSKNNELFILYLIREEESFKKAKRKKKKKSTDVVSCPKQPDVMYILDINVHLYNTSTQWNMFKLFQRTQFLQLHCVEVNATLSKINGNF